MMKALLVAILSSIVASCCCKTPITFRTLFLNSCSSNILVPKDTLGFSLAPSFPAPSLTSTSHPMSYSWIQRWLLGMVAVSLISLGSTLGYFLFALKNIDLVLSLEFAKGLGFGSLIGSALFHLIPHSFGLVGM